MARRYIEDFALLSDLHTAAIVSREGAVEWLCVPHFDSDSAFNSLLGNEDHGQWLLAPTLPLRSSRRYLDDTLVLETTHETASGVVRVIDFMPRREEHPTLIRIVEGVSGTVEMKTLLAVRFNFGTLPPWTRWLGDALTMTVGGNGMALHTDVDVTITPPDVAATFTVRAGERKRFVVQWYPGHERPPSDGDADELLEKTVDNWRKWLSQCAYDGEHADWVKRSLAVLKGLTYEPSGGCIAAATTSLPENPGDAKNWDYRFAWIRDSAYTVDALVAAGFTEEARAWRDWLLRMLAGAPEQLQIMYSIVGDRHLEEYNVDWLPGYEGSQPVRIGNEAYTQFQLGIYGELMYALTTAHEHGIEIDCDAWQMLRKLLDYVESMWREPDSGIWESRGPGKHYTSSRIMAWSAFDCALRLIKNDGYDGPVDRWEATRDAIHREVCEKAFDPGRNAFVQSYESNDLDASVLQIPIVGFLPISDERVRGTITAIENELLVDGFVMRTSSSLEMTGAGDLKLKEGAFLACCSWLVQCYTLDGRIADAKALFDRVLGVSNDLGLLSEEYHPRQRRLLGNFPQTFSHATLVNAAVELSRARTTAP